MNYFRKHWKWIVGLMIVGALATPLIQNWNAPALGFEKKTLWDWAELLIIPLVLAIGGFLLTRSENKSEREIAVERAETDRQIAVDRQQETLLQSYFDRMSSLLLKEGLRTAGEHDEVRSIAHSITHATLRNLDGDRKGLLIRFLHDVGLIIGENPIISLREADLLSVNLQRAQLRGANFNSAFMTEANLFRTSLFEAFLSDTNLQDANLGEAHLAKCDMVAVNLKNANLTKAYLREAHLDRTVVCNAVFIDAQMQNCQLPSASFIGCNLTGVKFRRAQLESVKIHQCKLTEASFPEAILRWARFSETEIKQGQLGEAKNIEDAVLDWSPTLEELAGFNMIC